MGDSNVSNVIPQTINLFKLSDYANGLVQIEKDIYLEKLVKVNIDCPYLFPDQMWQTSVTLLETFLPKIDRQTLYIYLIARRNKDTLIQLNAHKTMNESENYVKSGWVSSLAAINMESGNVIVRAAVHHSQSIRKKQLLPWVAIDSKTNIKIAANCQCTGGLSGVCCHVGAVCYSVIYANSLPSTSKENVWLDTHPKRSVELIKQISNLNSSQHEQSVEEIRKSQKRKIMLTSDIPVMSENEIKKFHEELIEHKSVQLMVLNNYSNHFTPPNLSKPLSELYNPSFLNKSYEEVLLECIRLEHDGCLKITKSQSDAVAKATTNQFKSPIWNRYRSGLPTASNSYNICHTNLDKPSLSLLKKIRYPAGSTFSTEATRYGISNESKCIRKAFAKMKKEHIHEGITITKCGLIISSEYLGMGASPDGLFHCDCHGSGVVEVKCSWKYRNSNSLIEVAESHTDFFLTFNTEFKNLTLKKNHPYYYQIQQQMIVTGTKFCIFLVFIESDIAIVSVPMDEELCSEITSKIHQYMVKVMLPQLLCDYFVKADWEKGNVSSGLALEIVIASELAVDSEVIESGRCQTTMLLCCQNVLKSNEQTVTCANVDCLICTFHKSCVMPPRKRFGAKWKCKACSALTKKVSKNKENTKVTKSKSKQSVKLVAKRGLSLKN